jgi:hypothetical protein
MEINAALIANFNNKLTYESWEDVINEKNINIAFNTFLNIYLTIFHSSFPIKKFMFTLPVNPGLRPELGFNVIRKKALFSSKK